MSTNQAPQPLPWRRYALLTVVLFGVWQALPKLPTLAVVSPLALQIAALPGLLAALSLTGAAQRTRGAARAGLAWAAGTGAAGALGTLAVLQAFALGGEGSVVTPLCAMYPLVTALGARIWLRERLGRAQKLGLVLFAAAVLAFGTDAADAAAGADLPWLVPAALALLLFGMCGLGMKLAAVRVSAAAALAAWMVGYVLASVVLALVTTLTLPRSAAFWALATAYGAALGLGMWTSFAAYQRGKASVVTAVTALYPAVTVVLTASVPSIGEPLRATKVLAVGLALIAGAALGIEPAVDSAARKSDDGG